MIPVRSAIGFEDVAVVKRRQIHVAGDSTVAGALDCE
jgi:hypothetical protein